MAEIRTTTDEVGKETAADEGLSKASMDRAIRKYAASNLKKSLEKMENRGLFLIPKPIEHSHSPSEISTQIESRLRELRNRFSSRVEEIRRQTLIPKKADEDEPVADEEEDTTTLTKTNADFNLDGPVDTTAKHSLWRHPPRTMHIRKPPFMIPVSPHKRPFVTITDKRLMYVVIDDGGQDDKLKQDTFVEVIGKEGTIPVTWTVDLPQWMPTPRDILTATVSPGGIVYLLWMFLVLVSFVYNAIVIPLREAFVIYDTSEYTMVWFVIDCVADAIYLFDFAIVKPRLQFINHGIVMTDFRTCAKNYIATPIFKLDVITVIPLDLFSLIYGRPMARFRVLRFFKFPILLEFFDRTDRRASAGFAVRLAKTLIYMLYIIHVECCGFYAFNTIQGLNATSWSIGQRNNNPYVYSFYVATKMASSIGNLPHATNPAEFLFMTTYWLTGVYVSAILIGQVIDILDNQRADREAYKKLMNGTISYLKQLRAPEEDINKVRTWFMFNWDQQKTLDENMLIETLPLKLKTDLLITVHFQTLSKVSLFQDCERTMIFDLICKLKPVLFLPGAVICMKGEVGLEMYIVKHGFVEVVGGPDNSIVFVTLKEGSVFGEISLLALSGKNRRTATVRSKGYSTLFLLTKKDFEEAMKNYPAAYKMLIRRAQKMLNRDKKKADEEAIRKAQEAEKIANNAEEDNPTDAEIAYEIISERAPTPKMTRVVDEVLRRKSLDPQFLRVRGQHVRRAIPHTQSLPVSNEADSHEARYINTAVAGMDVNCTVASIENSSTFNEDVSSLPDEDDRTVDDTSLATMSDNPRSSAKSENRRK